MLDHCWVCAKVNLSNKESMTEYSVASCVNYCKCTANYQFLRNVISHLEACDIAQHVQGVGLGT